MFVFLVASLLIVTPLAWLSHPELWRGGPRGCSCPGIDGGLSSDADPADYCHCRHHGGPLAAVLSAVERHRQADHATADHL